MALQNGLMRLVLCAFLIGTSPAWALAPHDKAVGVGHDQPINSKSASANDQNRSENNERGIQASPIIVKSLPPEKTEQETADDARERDAKHFNDNATLIVATGTLFFLGLQTIVFGLQAHRLKQTIDAMKAVGDGQSKDMREALDIARVNADSAKKSADFLAFQNAPVIYIQSIEFSNNRAIVSIGNSGKSMAIIQNLKFGYGVFDELPPVPTYHHDASAIVEIPPNTSYQFEGPFRQVVISQHEGIRKGEIFEFIWGIIVFCGEIHEYTEIGFCSRWGHGGYRPVVKEGYTYKRSYA